MDEEMKDVKEMRRLEVKLDKNRLMSAIRLAFRRYKIPNSQIGSDILFGCVYGKIRHPEIDIKTAISNAVDAGKLPGSATNVEDGIEYIYEVLEVVSNFEERCTMIESIEDVVNKIIDTIRMAYCYEVAVKLTIARVKNPSIGHEILKSMLFKKLYADESEWDCMLEYAGQKCRIFELSGDKKMKVLKEVEKVVPKQYNDDVETVKWYINCLVEEAYKL